MPAGTGRFCSFAYDESEPDAGSGMEVPLPFDDTRQTGCAPIVGLSRMISRR